ncbi:hypothetical protein K504DRAFT_537945 [Pleomassaria siparia CBS 279.74]|uniref:Uncharacterized protein n=1 Tax=Pleomassaria siparia CBS 279.74 TaxID=1314801 RepID=A0A6G1JV12_9PLEO|nr:hypothetical protein K504DRAFT_537945 [Pleomassaria siparia CBS 279.74]
MHLGMFSPKKTKAATAVIDDSPTKRVARAAVAYPFLHCVSKSLATHIRDKNVSLDLEDFDEYLSADAMYAAAMCEIKHHERFQERRAERNKRGEATRSREEEEEEEVKAKNRDAEREMWTAAKNKKKKKKSAVTEDLIMF